MALPTFTMRQLIEAGVHFGHNTRRWNPKMKPFIFGTRDSVHIIDLQQTVPMLYRAMQAVRDVAAQGGRVLFVGTKSQAQTPIREAAERCGQYYVNHRWLGGTLTKKEKLNIAREREKLDRSLGGIKEMGGRPDLIFVIDTIKEDLALHEARRLGIPVVAVCDSNSDPDNIDYPVPGNDDAIRAINLYCDLIAGSVLDGIQEEMAKAGVDLGAQETVVEEVEVNEDSDGEKAAEAEDKEV